MAGNRNKTFKLIACEVFTREICLVVSQSPHTISVVFTPLASHADSKKLRGLIQEHIDAAQQGAFDAVLLGFGLCGNSIEGLASRSVPLVVPRAHDCCTLFLGSIAAFLRHFDNNLSAEWGSRGYVERGGSYLHDTETDRMIGYDREYGKLVVQYGEESAKYLWDTLHPKIDQPDLFYISVPETDDPQVERRFRDKAAADGKGTVALPGSMRLLRMLVNGEWDDREFLTVAPGHRVRAAYDMETVVTAEKC